MNRSLGIMLLVLLVAGGAVPSAKGADVADAAKCSAVMPSPCAAFTSAPSFNSTFTAAKSPLFAAAVKGSGPIFAFSEF